VFPEISLGNEFLDQTPKAQARKARINKHKNTSKETVNKMKR
jgi:hypothetical protein